MATNLDVSNKFNTKQIETHEKYFEEDLIAGDVKTNLKAKITQAKQEFPEEDPEFVSKVLDVPVQVVGGFRDASQSILNLGSAGGEYITSKVLALQGYSKEDIEGAKADTKSDRVTLPAIPEAKSTVGDITRSISQFLTPFGAVSKGVKVAGLTPKIGVVTAGAVTDFVAFEEHEQRLSNVIEQVPSLKNPITEYLQTDLDDDVVEGRLKNVLEGAVLGTAAEAMFKTIKYIKLGKKSREAIQHSSKIIDDSLLQIAEKRTKLETLIKGSEAANVVTAESAAKRVVSTLGKAEANKSTMTLAQIKAEGEAALAKGQVSLESLASNELYTEFKETNILGKVESVNILQKKAYDTILPILSHVTEAHKLGIHSLDEKALKGVNSFLTFWAEATDNISDIGRALGSRGHSPHVIHVNKFMKELRKAPAKDKSHFLRTMHGVFSSGGDINKFVELVASEPVRGNLLDNLGDYYAKTNLSSPLTLMGDTVSTILWSANLVGERAVAASINPIRKKISKWASEGAFVEGMDKVSFGEVRVMLSGMNATVIDGFRYMSKAFSRTTEKAATSERKLSPIQDINEQLGESRIDYLDRFEGLDKAKLFSKATWVKGEDTSLSKYLLGVSSAIIQAPGDAAVEFMRVKDSAAKIIMYRGEARALAYRKALSEGLDGEELEERASDLFYRVAPDKTLDRQSLSDNELIQYSLDLTAGRATPDQVSDMVAREISTDSVKFANQSTFTSDIHPFFKAAVEATPGGKILVPYMKTGINITKELFSRSALAPLAPSIRADIKKGGARADLAISKIAMGSMYTYLGWKWAVEGRINGDAGLMNQSERTELLGTGWKPNSLFIDGKYIPLQRFAPISSQLLVGANIAELYHINDNLISGDLERDVMDLAGASVLELGEMFISANFSANLADLITAISENDGKKSEQILNFIASGFVPNAVGFAGNLINPEMQTSTNMWEAIKIKAGFDLDQEYIGLFGETIKKNKQLLGYVVPLAYSPITEDPFYQNLVSYGARLKPVPKRIDGVQLTYEEHHALKKLMGEKDATGMTVKEEIELLMQFGQGSYPNVSLVGTKREPTMAGMIEKIYNDRKKAAKELLVYEFPDLARRINELEVLKNVTNDTSIQANTVLDSQRGLIN